MKTSPAAISPGIVYGRYRKDCLAPPATVYSSSKTGLPGEHVQRQVHEERGTGSQKEMSKLFPTSTPPNPRYFRQKAGLYKLHECLSIGATQCIGIERWKIQIPEVGHLWYHEGDPKVNKPFTPLVMTEEVPFP
jgi:hypothetical protein